MSSINRRFVLVRTDEHGTRVAVAIALTAALAKERLRDILKSQNKPHHQAYDILEYELGHFSEFCDQEHIRR